MCQHIDINRSYRFRLIVNSVLSIIIIQILKIIQYFYIHYCNACNMTRSCIMGIKYAHKVLRFFFSLYIVVMIFNFEQRFDFLPLSAKVLLQIFIGAK